VRRTRPERRSRLLLRGLGDPEELAEVRWLPLAEADELLTGMYQPVRAHLDAAITDR
jgi:hypothetical protein